MNRKRKIQNLEPNIEMEMTLARTCSADLLLFLYSTTVLIKIQVFSCLTQTQRL